MKVIKKINNNVALGLDGNNHEVIIFGKGIGFEKMPYELTDLSRVDRTYYDIDRRYYGLLTEIPEKTFLLVTKLLDTARSKIQGNLNPNLVFVLADPSRCTSSMRWRARRQENGTPTGLRE